MAHGVRVWDPQADLMMDVTDRLTRFVHVEIAAQNDDGSKVITLPSAQCRVIAMLDGDVVGDFSALPHKVDLAADGTLSWSSHSSGDVDSGPTRIMVITDG